MEKHAYEAYEFLAATSTNPDSDTNNQFFVLQEDGTILSRTKCEVTKSHTKLQSHIIPAATPIFSVFVVDKITQTWYLLLKPAVNNEIQYITQVEDEKAASATLNPSDGCAVFDVPSQQYFVDVEGNASQIISMNDQFAVTNGENNVYTTSYLIQPEISATTHIETDAVDPETLDAQQLQQHNVEALNGTKQATDLTEITLSDEQYQVLQQKGWILMESNDKVFVLNSLGLHDITTDDKLIQKLKNELQDDADPKTTTNIGQLKIENISAVPNESNDTVIPEQADIVEYFIPENPLDIQNSEPEGNLRFIVNENEDDDPNKTCEVNCAAEVPQCINNLNDATHASKEPPKKCDFIKIKTKHTFTDIPDKIFLGKMVNGKKLFAKVTKRKKRVNIIYGKKIEKKTLCSTSLDAVRFTNIIQDSFRETSVLSPETVAEAHAIVSQLLRLSNIKNSILGTNLVVTKITISETDSGKEVAQPTMVTGVVMKQQNGEHGFFHMPFMLEQLLDNSEHENTKKYDPLTLESPEERTARGLIELFHIHVSEMWFTDKPPQTSVSLSKRKLALDVLNDAKKRHPNPVYACGTCGAVFKSEVLLKHHQDNECLEVDDELTIDTGDINTENEKLYSIIQNGKEKLYSCTLCEAKFSRRFNCLKHIKAHKAGKEKKSKIYKCKMCPNTYFHTSSLAKHIVKMHIQTQLK